MEGKGDTRNSGESSRQQTNTIEAAGEAAQPKGLETGQEDRELLRHSDKSAE